MQCNLEGSHPNQMHLQLQKLLFSFVLLTGLIGAILYGLRSPVQSKSGMTLDLALPRLRQYSQASGLFAHKMGPAIVDHGTLHCMMHEVCLRVINDRF